MSIGIQCASLQVNLNGGSLSRLGYLLLRFGKLHLRVKGEIYMQLQLKPLNLAFLIFLGLALPGLALAQRGGGGSVGGGGNMGSTPRSTPNGSINPNSGNNLSNSRSITGILVELNPAENSISIKNNKDGKVVAFTVVPKAKLKADKKTDLADKKDIKLADFKPGETLEITYMGDGTVTEVRLKHEKEKKESAEAEQKTS
jgi:hypothetical protein